MFFSWPCTLTWVRTTSAFYFSLLDVKIVIMFYSASSKVVQVACKAM